MDGLEGSVGVFFSIDVLLVWREAASSRSMASSCIAASTALRTSNEVDDGEDEDTSLATPFEGEPTGEPVGSVEEDTLNIRGCPTGGTGKAVEADEDDDDDDTNDGG